MKVLITGAAGFIGSRLVTALEPEHTLVLGDVQHDATDPRRVLLDITKPETLHAAVKGVDAIIHLAIASGHEGDHEDDTFNQLRFDVNVKGTWNLLEAARRAGVTRFVFTSSLTVVWGYEPPEWVESDAEPRPVGTYAQTKLLGEVLCEQAAAASDLSIVCLRIPKPVPLDDPGFKQRTLRPQWIAFPDLANAFGLALTAADIDFEIVTVVGESSKRRWDLSKAERVLGYRPIHRLEDMGYNIGDENEPLVIG